MPFLNALLINTQYVLPHKNKEYPGAEPGTPEISKTESLATIING